MPYAGKVFPLDYDDIIAAPLDTSSCSFCLSQNEIEAILAVLLPLHWKTRWDSSVGTVIDQDTVDSWVSELEKKLMAACQNDIVLTRIDGDGNWQISTDGGVTWTDAPGQDPRNATPLAPPVSGADGDSKRCAGANSIITYFKELAQNIHDAKAGNLSLTAFTAVLTGILLLLGIVSGGWLLVVLGALIPLLWKGADLEQWDAAINDDMWQKFICAIYPFINADCSVTDFMGMVNAVNSQLDDTVARATWEMYLKLMGNTGITNAARNGYGGDLECTCACDPMNYEIFNGDENYGTITYHTNYFDLELMFAPNSVGEYYGRVHVTTGDCCPVVSWEVISGASANIHSYATCGESELPITHNLSDTTGSGEDTVRSMAFGAVSASTIRVHLG